MGIFTVHPSITNETINIHPEPQNLAKYDKKWEESMADSQGGAGPAKQTQHTMLAEDTMTSKEKGYVSSDTNKVESLSEWLEPEVYDVTNDWVDAKIHTMVTQEKASSCNKYIHPDSDIHQRPPVKSKAELREMYPGCFSGVDKFKDF